MGQLIEISEVVNTDPVYLEVDANKRYAKLEDMFLKWAQNQKSAIGMLRFSPKHELLEYSNVRDLYMDIRNIVDKYSDLGIVLWESQDWSQSSNRLSPKISDIILYKQDAIYVPKQSAACRVRSHARCKGINSDNTACKCICHAVQPTKEEPHPDIKVGQLMRILKEKRDAKTRKRKTRGPVDWASVFATDMANKEDITPGSIPLGDILYNLETDKME